MKKRDLTMTMTSDGSRNKKIVVSMIKQYLDAMHQIEVSEQQIAIQQKVIETEQKKIEACSNYMKEVHNLFPNLFSEIGLASLNRDVEIPELPHFTF